MNEQLFPDELQEKYIEQLFWQTACGSSDMNEFVGAHFVDINNARIEVLRESMGLRRGSLIDAIVGGVFSFQKALSVVVNKSNVNYPRYEGIISRSPTRLAKMGEKLLTILDTDTSFTDEDRQTLRGHIATVYPPLESIYL